MASFSRMIDLKIKDKSINIELIDDFDELNNEIISILEKEYNKKLSNSNKFYNLYYFDEDKDKYPICSKSDYTFFVNGSYNVLYVDINEFSINQIESKEDNIEKIDTQLSNENELALYQRIDELSKLNLELKKEKEISNEKNKIYLEKIKILEEDAKLKQEKEQSIMQCLAQEKKEKKEIIEELEESKKLNQSMSMIIEDESPKDIMINNLKEDKALLESHLKEERDKINLIEKVYSESNKLFQEKIKILANQFNIEKQKMIENNNILIQNEIQKGINDYINKSQLELQNKQNEINNMKNDYQNNIEKIREECYEEIEQKISKIYERKLKEIYDSESNKSKIMYEQILSKNQQQFEEEEKKRNQVIDANIFNNAHENFNIKPISKCKTVHNGITCNFCKKCPIVGFRYKCMECPDYNLCQNCEKAAEHEHNFIRFFTEEKKE